MFHFFLEFHELVLEFHHLVIILILELAKQETTEEINLNLHNLPGLVKHLHFFAGVSVRLKFSY
ncbi:MAG: hypothetical protein ACFFDT_20135, partial [Candidatus Hodarchaeota archaeon]